MNGKDEDFKRREMKRWEAEGGRGGNGWVGMSCFGVVTLLIVISEEALTIKEE